jgi:nicotinamide mononucleotide (NMN) deamidase PncC
MAMDGNAMGDAVAAALVSVISAQGQGSPDINQMKKIWEAVCTEIVGHIRQNAEVPAGISTTGPEGPGSTTGTGTVT